MNAQQNTERAFHDLLRVVDNCKGSKAMPWPLPKFDDVEKLITNDILTPRQLRQAISRSRFQLRNPLRWPKSRDIFKCVLKNSLKREARSLYNAPLQVDAVHKASTLDKNMLMDKLKPFLEDKIFDQEFLNKLLKTLVSFNTNPQSILPAEENAFYFLPDKRLQEVLEMMKKLFAEYRPDLEVDAAPFQ